MPDQKDFRKISAQAKALANYTPGNQSIETLSQATAPREDKKIGDYTIGRMIGSGGMGVVYLATHDHLNSKHAVKILSQFGNAKPELRSRFQKEMKSIAMLNHPNIVRATDARADNGEFALVMDYIEGVSLDKQDLPVEIGKACRIIQQIALALEHVHEKGIVHRDLKPSNVMITKKGQTKLVDFGLALLNDVNPDLTNSGVILGTPRFMAPEQFTNSRGTTSAADIYGLGSIFVFLLTGDFERSLVGSRDDLESLLNNPVIPRQPAKPTDKRVVNLIEKMLARSPKLRPSAAEVARELAQISKSLSKPQVITGSMSGLTKPWLIALAAVLVLVAGTAGWFALNQELRIKTDQGVLVINYDGEQNSVEVLDNRFVVKDLKTGKEHMVRLGKNDLPTGDYVFEVETSGGLHLQTREFSLSKNGNAVVTAKMESPEEKKDNDQNIRAMPKRTGEPALAEMILHLRGKFKTHFQAKEDEPISTFEDFPKGDFDIRIVTVTDIAEFNDESLRLLESADRISGLIAERTSITEDGLISFLRRFKNLEWLYLAGLPLSDSSLQVLSTLKKLESLDIRASKVTDDGLALLKNNKKLVKLWVSNNEQITDAGMLQLSRLTQLGELHVDDTSITDKGLAHLANLTELEKLFVINCDVSENAIQKLQGKLPNCRIVTAESDSE